MPCSSVTRGEIDPDGLTESVRALMRELGKENVLDALVKRMEGTSEVERETLMLLVPRLKSKEAIDYLWHQVRRSRTLSLETKTTVLVMLKEMGEEVDLSGPGQYFSPRDFKPKDLKTMEDLLRWGLHGIVNIVRSARDAVEVEALMHQIQQTLGMATDRTQMLLQLTREAEAEGTALAADLLYAIAYTTPYADVRHAAEQALMRLEARGIKPVTRAILELGQARFYAAYSTDPRHPWQQSIVVGWKRAPRVIQGLSFLLDFGLP